MLMKKCERCNEYTLEESCPVCKTKAISAHPSKFSLEKERKYGKYRRTTKANV